MQIDVHHIHAEIAWTGDAYQRVHVRAVHIEERSLGVQDFRDLWNTLLEDTQRLGIGDHQRGDISGHQVAQFVDVDLAVRFRLDVFDFVARNHRRRRICPVRGIRN